MAADVEALKELYLVSLKELDVPALEAASAAAKSTGVNDKIIDRAEKKLHQAKKKVSSIERSTEREEAQRALENALATRFDLTKITGLDLAKLRAAVEKAEELRVSAKLTTDGWILLTTLERAQVSQSANLPKPHRPLG